MILYAIKTISRTPVATAKKELVSIVSLYLLPIGPGILTQGLGLTDPGGYGLEVRSCAGRCRRKDLIGPALPTRPWPKAGLRADWPIHNRRADPILIWGQNDRLRTLLVSRVATPPVGDQADPDGKLQDQIG